MMKWLSIPTWSAYDEDSDIGGEIHEDDGEFYWSARDADGASGSGSEGSLELAMYAVERWAGEC
jgi:hypothetical protein